MSSLVQTKALTKTYGTVRALDSVDLQIEPGRIVGLVGPNGAGKTTLLRALTGQLEYEGEVSVLDLEPYSRRAELMAHTGVIHDVAVLPGWMQVSDVLHFTREMHPGFDESRAREFIKKTSIPLNQKVKNLSKGMKTQLHLALVLATESRLLILDEPTHGLDILFRKQLYTSVLEDYFDQDKSILISTHQIEEVEHILSDVIFIRNGRVLLHASMEELAERFLQITIAEEDAEQVLTEVKPLVEYKLLGRRVLLLDGADREALADRGEIKTPTIADIFVALMGEQSGGAA